MTDLVFLNLDLLERNTWQNIILTILLVFLHVNIFQQNYICQHPDPRDLHYFYPPLLDFDPVFEGQETPCRFLLPVPPIHNIEESREAGKEEKMMECNYSRSWIR